MIVYLVFLRMKKKRKLLSKGINSTNWIGLAILIICLISIIWVNPFNKAPIEKVISGSICRVWNYDGTDSLVRLFFNTDKNNKSVFHLKHSEIKYLTKQTNINIFSYCKMYKIPCTEKDFELYFPYIKTKQVYKMPVGYSTKNSSYVGSKPTIFRRH